MPAFVCGSFTLSHPSLIRVVCSLAPTALTVTDVPKKATTSRRTRGKKSDEQADIDASRVDVVSNLFNKGQVGALWLGTSAW